MEKHRMRHALIVSSDLFGKCMDKRKQGVKIPCYQFIIGQQAFFFPSKQMACEGRTIILGHYIEKQVLADYAKLQDKRESLTLKEQQQLDWCNQYIQSKSMAKSEILKKMMEHQAVLGSFDQEVVEFHHRFEIEQYQTTISQILFLDDPDIIKVRGLEYDTPTPRSRAEMYHDPYCNFTTPSTIYFGLEDFKRQTYFTRHTIGAASSYLVVGSSALLLGKVFASRYFSFDGMFCYQNLNNYHLVKLMHSWLESLPPVTQEIALKHLDCQERKHKIAGSKYYEGNQNNKNLDKFNKIVNDWIERRWIDFKKSKEEEMKAKEMKEQHWNEFVEKMDKEEELKVQSAKTMIIKRIEATIKSGEWPPARRKRIKELNDALIAGPVNYQHIRIHFETIAKHLESQSREEEQKLANSDDNEVTTNSKDKSPSVDHVDLDLLCSGTFQGAARRALKRERKMKAKIDKQGL